MKYSLIMFAFLAAAFAEAAAQNREKVSLDEIVSIALLHSPLAQKAMAASEATRAEGIALSTLENPILDGEVRIPGSYRDSRGADEISVSISQPLRLSNFGLRGRINQLIGRVSEQESKLGILELSQKVRLSYAKVWAIEQRAAQLEALSKQIHSLQSTINDGAAKGLFSSADSLILKAEALSLENHKRAAKSDLLRARAELNSHVGEKIEGALIEPVISSPPEISTLLDDNGRLPMTARMELAARLAEHQLQLSKLDAMPKIAPRLIYERNNEYTDYFGVGLSIDLPLFDRNQAERVRRTAQDSAARAELRYFSGEGYQQEVELRRGALIDSIQLSKSLNGEIVPALRQAFDAQTKLLQSGQGSVLQIWQVLKELSQSQEDGMERTIAAHMERSEFVIFIGSEF